MPRITNPQQQQITQATGIGTNPRSNAQAIANVVDQAGAATFNMGQQFFDKAKETLDNNQYSKAISEATAKFNERYQERLNNRLDDEGNPTFEALGSDVQKIADEIRAEAGNSISDMGVSQRFNQDFGRFATNKGIQAQAEARNQFMDYSQATLAQSTRALIDQATTDSAINANGYIADIDKLLMDGIDGGLISQQQAAEFKQAATSEIRVTLFSQAISQDPHRSLAQLQKKHTTLGITEQERQGLIGQAEGAIRDQQREVVSRQAKLDTAIKEQQDNVKLDLQIGIHSNIVGEKEVIEALNSRQITEKQSKQLRLEIIKKSKTEVGNKAVLDSIDLAVKNKGYMGNFSSSQIDKSYASMVKSATKSGVTTGVGTAESIPPGLQEKAKFAGKYTVPVAAFSKELSYAITQGADHDAAMQSFAFLSSTNPISLSRLDKEAMSVGGMALSLIRGTGISPKDAVARARDIYTTSAGSTDIQNQNVIEFNKLSQAKLSVVKEGKVSHPMNEVVIDMFDLDSTFGFGGKTIAPGVAEEVQQVIKANYAIAGDWDKAVEISKTQMEPFYGTTEVVEESGLLDDTETFMRLPPEKLFPGADPDIMREDLHTTVQAIEPDIDTDNIHIRSDRYTSTNSPSYGIFKVVDGLEVPLKNDSGEIQRWYPPVDALNNQAAELQSKGIEEAKQARKDIPDAKRKNKLGSFGLRPGQVTQRSVRAKKELK